MSTATATPGWDILGPAPRHTSRSGRSSKSYVRAQCRACRRVYERQKHGLAASRSCAPCADQARGERMREARRGPDRSRCRVAPAWRVACAYCGAAAGAPCVSPDGVEWRGFAHAMRWEAVARG